MRLDSGRRPLRRFRVLDLSHARAGPVTVRQLSDWGADVLRIERVEATQASDDLIGRRDGGDFQNLHRNKRSLSLNLKVAEAVEIFMKLAKDADVIVENMRADVKFRLGVDYETVRKINPGIVYGSISGYGQDGPYAERGGVDQIAQGIGGLMSVTGVPGQGPLRVGIPIADLTAGIFLAQGILVALLDREVTGQGTWVQTSLLQAQVAMLDGQAMRWLVDGHLPEAVGNDHPTGVPMGTFRTAGDEYMNIAASSQRLFTRFCEATGLAHLLSDRKFTSVAGRRQNAAELKSIVAARLMEKTASEWSDILNPIGVPCGPVLDISQVFEDPQVKHLRIARPVPHPEKGEINLLVSPIDILGVSKDIERPTPNIGQNSNDVLHALGYDDTAIAALRAQGVI
ncbi:CaiB/BaiF CoA-transferase family protein [Corticibacterium sp. UT-5YL-CI-8]|nr:CaiB/BaiF CoA-transferase family protein [Tianweitania sp. UT-5YL-CI-8]